MSRSESPMLTVYGLRSSGNCYKLQHLLELLGRTLQWMFFEQYSHEPYVAVARSVRRWLPEGHPRHAELPRLMERGAQAFGIADIALFAYTHCAADGGFDLSRWPHITAWLERVRAQPGFSPMAA